MSHAVSPTALAEVATPYGNAPFLLYPSAAGAVRANHIRVTLTPDDPVVMVTGFGRGVAGAITREAPLTLLWPSPTDGDFSLIADGTGAMVDDHTLAVTVTGAVLHRPAPADGESRSC